MTSNRQGYDIATTDSGKWFLIYIESGKSLQTQVDSMLDDHTTLYIQNAFTYSPPNLTVSTDSNINQANGTSHFTGNNSPNSLTLYANCINYKAVDRYSTFEYTIDNTWKRNLFDLTPFKDATFSNGITGFLLPCWVQLIAQQVTIPTLDGAQLNYNNDTTKFNNSGWYCIGLDNNNRQNFNDIFLHSVYHDILINPKYQIAKVYKPNKSTLPNYNTVISDTYTLKFWDDISNTLVKNTSTCEVEKFEHYGKNVYWVYIIVTNV